MKKSIVLMAFSFFLINFGVANAVTCRCANATGSALHSCPGGCSVTGCQFPAGTDVTCTPVMDSQTPVPSLQSQTPAGASTQLDDPLGKRGFEKITNDAISFILGLTGVLALISFIYGGILWMLSRGDTAFIKKGKDMMIWSVWGIVIIFAAYAILKVVFQALGLKS